MQPERIREPNPDADQAHDAKVQREIDAAEAKRRAAGYSPEQLRTEPEPAKPVPCHNCDTPYIGVKCAACGEFRPAYLALVSESRR